MNKPVMITSAALITTAVSTTVYYYGSRKATLARFPDVDPKIAKKVYAQIFRESMSGQYADLELTDEKLDAIFNAKVQLLSK